jgi:uncharacterized protein
VRHLIEITAADIEGAGLAVDMVLPQGWISAQAEDAEARATGDGHIRARLSRSGRADVVVRGTVTAQVEMPCARCLKPAIVDVNGELALLLKPNPSPSKAKAAEPSRSARKSERGATAVGGAAGDKAHAEKAHAEKAHAEKAHGEKAHADRARTARLAEYEFSAEEAEHDEYDGDKVVLDGFVREAILLELPNFPLCSETCTGISPRLPGPRPSAPGGNGGPSTGAPMRVNPFEALKHLSGGLPKGPALEGGAPPAEDRPIPLDRPSEPRLQRGEAKIASTHSAPHRKPAPKKKSSPAGGSAKKGRKKP